MLRYFFFLSLYLFVHTTTAINPLFNKELSFGLSQGVVSPSVNFSPMVSQSASIQYYTGIAFRYIAEPNVGIQAELNYSQRGWNEISHTEGSFSKQIDYLELPLLTHIFVGNNAVRFIVLAGPTLKYAIQEKNISTYINSTNYQHITQIDNKFDYSLLGGIGLEIRTRKLGFFQLDVRYDFGISDIYNNRKSDYFSRSSNQAIMAGFHYYPIFINK